MLGKVLKVPCESARQSAGMELHRRRLVIVRTTEADDVLEMVRIVVNDVDHARCDFSELCSDVLRPG